MAEKTFNNVRVVQKHDTATNWSKATNFIPKQGEVIVYDVDSDYSYERLKIGDGVKNVNALPFVTDALQTSMEAQLSTLGEEIETVDGRVDTLSALVGDTAVSEQISTAINETTADDFGVYVQAQEPTDAVAGDIWIDTANDPSYIPPTLPEITEADNGKVLMVVNGKLQLVNLNLTTDANGVLSI